MRSQSERTINSFLRKMNSEESNTDTEYNEYSLITEYTSWHFSYRNRQYYKFDRNDIFHKSKTLINDNQKTGKKNLDVNARKIAKKCFMAILSIIALYILLTIWQNGCCVNGAKVEKMINYGKKNTNFLSSNSFGAFSKRRRVSEKTLRVTLNSNVSKSARADYLRISSLSCVHTPMRGKKLKLRTQLCKTQLRLNTQRPFLDLKTHSQAAGQTEKTNNYQFLRPFIEVKMASMSRKDRMRRLFSDESINDADTNVETSKTNKVIAWIWGMIKNGISVETPDEEEARINNLENLSETTIVEILTVIFREKQKTYKTNIVSQCDLTRFLEAPFFPPLIGEPDSFPVALLHRSNRAYLYLILLQKAEDFEVPVGDCDKSDSSGRHESPDQTKSPMEVDKPEDSSSSDTGMKLPKPVRTIPSSENNNEDKGSPSHGAGSTRQSEAYKKYDFRFKKARATLGSIDEVITPPGDKENNSNVASAGSGTLSTPPNCSDCSSLFDSHGNLRPHHNHSRRSYASYRQQGKPSPSTTNSPGDRGRIEIHAGHACLKSHNFIGDASPELRDGNLSGQSSRSGHGSNASYSESDILMVTDHEEFTKGVTFHNRVVNRLILNSYGFRELNRPVYSNMTARPDARYLQNLGGPAQRAIDELKSGDPHLYGKRVNDLVTYQVSAEHHCLLSAIITMGLFDNLESTRMNTELLGDYRRLEAALHGANQDVKFLHGQVFNLRRDMVNLRRERNLEHEAKIKEMQKERRALREQLSDLETENVVLRSQAIASQNKVQSVNTKLATLQSHIRAAKSEIAHGSSSSSECTSGLGDTASDASGRSMRRFMSTRTLSSPSGRVISQIRGPRYYSGADLRFASGIKTTIVQNARKDRPASPLIKTEVIDNQSDPEDVQEMPTKKQKNC